MQYLGKNRINAEQFTRGILSGDKVLLSRALSVIESSLESDKTLKFEILEGIVHRTGGSIRLGITGAPGVGKSTFIENLGMLLISNGHRLAVLTVDPSSQLSQGSILGDKTRMEQLSKSEAAYIRPSAAGKSLGGVAHHTRESILLCEAAGYDVVIVETVGVGQSEFQVRHMVDFFLLLLLAGAGDELQGIKKGIVEMADCLVINKADGENLENAQQARSIYQNALHYLTPKSSQWEPQVFTCSALNREGIDQVWSNVKSFKGLMESNGYFEKQREQQRIVWMEDSLKQAIEQHLRWSKDGKGKMELLTEQVKAGEMLPTKAAALILQELLG